MQNASAYVLGKMPAIEPIASIASITSLIVSPDEVLRPDARCSRPQCRITDDFLVKSYDTAANMGHVVAVSLSPNISPVPVPAILRCGCFHPELQ